MRKITYSFEQVCIDNNREDILKFWHTELNEGITPDKVAFRSNKKFWFWCGNPEHSPRQIVVDNITKAITNNKDYLLCIGCNSIGQQIVDNCGKEYLEKIWSDKNELSPFDILRGSTSKIWLRCLANVGHKDYDIVCNNFFRTHNCPYCAGKRPSNTNNALLMYPELKELWSDKNEKSPEEYTYGSNKNVWLKCSNHKHEDFQREIGNIKANGLSCPKCVEESIIRYEDLTGQRFGKLVVTGIDREGSDRAMRWFCDCDCGTKHKSILASHLKAGKIISCGCVWLGLSDWDKQRIGNRVKKNATKEMSENHKIRNSTKYACWRRDVLNKDGYKCVLCGSDHRNEVHHIYPFVDYEDLRFDINNGITLCFEHHNMFIEGSFHNVYGSKNNTPQQLEDYINATRASLGITEHFDIQQYMKEKREKGEKGRMNTNTTNTTTNKVQWNDEFFTDEELNAFYEGRTNEPLCSYAYRLRHNLENNLDSNESVDIDNTTNKHMYSKHIHILPRYLVKGVDFK